MHACMDACVSVYIDIHTSTQVIEFIYVTDTGIVKIDLEARLSLTHLCLASHKWDGRFKISNKFKFAII